MDTNISYFAGLLDGEGTFTIKRYKRYNDKSKLFYQTYISCSFAESDLTSLLLKKLQKEFGGSISQWKQNGESKKRDVISWSIVSRDAVKCAKRLKHHLKLKKLQAEILIKLGKRMKNIGHRGLSDKEYETRGNIYWEMRKLNVKGKLHLQRLNEATSKEDVIV